MSENTTTIVDRLKLLLQYFGMSENKFATEIGMKSQTLNTYTSGKRGVSYEVVDKILAKFPSISAEWLLRGIGNMLNGCGCTSPDDPSLYGKTSSVCGNETANETANGGDIKDERIKLLEERIAFLEEQVEFYKNKNT